MLPRIAAAGRVRVTVVEAVAPRLTDPRLSDPVLTWAFSGRVRKRTRRSARENRRRGFMMASRFQKWDSHGRTDIHRLTRRDASEKRLYAWGGLEATDSVRGAEVLLRRGIASILLQEVTQGL